MSTLEFSKLNGYNVKDKYTRYKNVFNAKQEGLVGDGTTDDTTALQNLIDRVYDLNGGTIIFEKGNYLISSVTLKSKVNLIGFDKGNTCIIQKSESTEPMIIIDEFTQDLNIESISFIGNDVDETDGILIKQVNLSSVNNNHDGMSDSDYVNELDNQVSYKYLTINDCYISHFNGNGITIKPNVYAINIINCYISFNKGTGLYNESTDNNFNNLQVERNGLNGLYFKGSNNKLSNIKSIWNGYLDPTSYGLYIKSSRNSITTCECQDNFCNGIGVEGYNNSFNGCLSDCNGYDYEQYQLGNIVGNTTAYLYYIKGSGNSFTGCQASQYRNVSPIASHSIYLDVYQKDNKFSDIKVQSNCAKNISVYTNELNNVIYPSLSSDDTLNSNGLKIGANGTQPARIYKKLEFNNIISMLYEFEYHVSGGYPRLIGFDCTDSTDTNRPFLLLWNGTGFTIYLQGRSVTLNVPEGFSLVDGITYRIGIVGFSNNDRTTFKMSISYIDSNTNVTYNTDAIENSFNGTHSIGIINTINFNNSSSSSARHSSLIKKLLITNREIPIHYQDISIDMSKAFEENDFYVDFTKSNNGYEYSNTTTNVSTYFDNYSGGYNIEGEKIKLHYTFSFGANAFNSGAGNNIKLFGEMPVSKYNTKLSLIDITSQDKIADAYITGNTIKILTPSSLYDYNGHSFELVGEYYRK